MKSIIHKYIEDNEHATFSEMERDIEGFTGDCSLVFNENDNLIVWPTISADASDAIRFLIKEKKIRPEVVESVLYRFEVGKVPDMPIAKSPGKITTPHWLPVVVHFVA